MVQLMNYADNGKNTTVKRIADFYGFYAELIAGLGKTVGF